MKVLLLNQDWFKHELMELGHEVVTAGFEFASHLDYTTSQPMLHIDRLIEKLPGGFQPECIVALDNSAPFILTGWEETSLPTIFYGVDAQHHCGLHRYLHEVFDFSLTAQKDYLPFYQEWEQSIEWMPLWASRHIEPEFHRKKHGAVFIGTLDAELNPDRVRFFEALNQRVEVLCTTGEYWNYFPYSEIVINQTVKSDLNFRVFEALMSGALLLTEHSENGLLELFEDGVHLVTYERNNVEQAASLINHYTTHPEQARAIGKAGRERVLELHTPKARAARLSEIMKTTKKRHSSRKYRSMAVNHICIARSKRRLDDTVRLLALTSCLKSFEQALEHGETLDDATSAYLWIATYEYDRITTSRAGYRLLKRFWTKFPDQLLLTMGMVRGALNNEERPIAEQILKDLTYSTLSEAYSESERYFKKILEDL